MEVAATKFEPEASTKLAVKGKEAIMDAVEDIIFGSVWGLIPLICHTN